MRTAKPARLHDRLSPATVRWMYRMGWDSVEIARKFGLKEHEVWNVLARDYTLMLPEKGETVT